MVTFLLDTNVISEGTLPHPDEHLLQLLALHAGALAISTISVHELWFGVNRLPRSRRKADLGGYLETTLVTLPVLPYDDSAARWHAEERARLEAAGRTLPYADGQIAAIAATQDLTLVTRNAKDFKRFKGLRVVSWWSC